MSLEEIDNNLNSNKYNPNDSVIHDKAGTFRDINHDWKYIQNKTNSNNYNDKNKTHWSLIILGVSVISLFIAIFYGAYTLYYKSNQLDENKISVSLDSPDSIEPGKSFNIKVITSNYNKIAINNVKIDIEYDKSTDSNGVKNVNKKEIIYDTMTYGVAKIENLDNNTVYGRGGDTIQLKLKLSYQISGNGAQFYKNINKEIKLLPYQISVKIDGPKDIDTGEAFTYKIIVKNDGEQDIDNGHVTLSFPAEYNTLQASTPLDSKSQWLIGKIVKGNEYINTVVATQMGVSGENKVIRAKLEETVDNASAVVNNYDYEYNIIYQPLILSTKLKVDHSDSNYIYKGQAGTLNISWENTIHEAITNLHFVLVYNSTSTNINKDNYPNLADIGGGTTGSISVPIIGDGDKNGIMRVGIIAYGDRLQSSMSNDKVGNSDIAIKVKDSSSR